MTWLAPKSVAPLELGVDVDELCVGKMVNSAPSESRMMITVCVVLDDLLR